MKKITNTVLYLALTVFALVCCRDTALAQGNTISVSPTNLNFVGGVGLPPPTTQFVQILSTSSTPVPFTIAVVSASNWLVVSPLIGTATQTSQLQLYADPTKYVNFAQGTYTATVTITPMTGSPVVLNPTLSIGTGSPGTGTFSSMPTAIVFNTTAGATPSPVGLTINTTGPPTTVTVAITGTAANAIQVSSSSLSVGPGSSGALTVSATPAFAALLTGNYAAQINVTPAGFSAPAFSVVVTIIVGNSTGTGTGITASPNSLTFNVSTGSTAQQTLAITTTSNTNETVTPSVTSGGTFLSVSGSISITASRPDFVTVTVNPAALTPGVTYSGIVSLANADFGTTTVPVTVNVGASGGGTLTATPSQVSISIQSGSTAPVSQTLSVTGTPIGATVIATATGLSWLSVIPNAFQLTGAPIAFSVTANPIGQTPGTYNGSIVLTPSSGIALTVPVTVTIGTAPSLGVSPTTLAFAYQTGTAFPVPQTIALSSTGSALSFGVTATTQSGGNWLVVTPQTGATPSNLSVQVNPAGLLPGSYQGTITVTSNGATNGVQTIPVSLLVTTQPILQLSTNGVLFNFQFGSATLPSQQQIQVSSSGNPLTFTVTTTPISGGNFITVTPTIGTTPQTLNLSVNPTVLANLAPGTYTSTVTLTAQGSGNGTVNIPISLVVGSSTLLSVSQTSLNFVYQIGQAVPANQTFNVSSTGAPLSYTVTATPGTCLGSTLTANPATGSTANGSNVAVSVNIAGLAAGTCNGTVTITSPGAGNSPLVVPVAIQVSNTPLLNVSPGAITVTTQIGSIPPSQNVSLTSTDPATALNFNVSTPSSGLLSVNLTSGTTPNNLTIGFQTAGLTAGTYTGSVTITPTAAGSSPTVIPVTLVITTNATATATPASLTFTQSFGGPQPAAQTINFTSTTSGLSFSASAVTLNGGAWLSVASSAAATPATLTVTANGTNLGQGSYSGVITILIPGAANNPLNVPVTLNIGAAQSLAATPAVLNFTYPAGSGTGPAAQNVQVTSSSGGSLSFTVTSASPSGALIAATPTSGTTPGTVAVSLNQSVLSTLAAGSYTGTVTIASAAGGSQIIAVNVTVTAALPPAITTLVNSASNTPGAVAPGEIVTIFGTNIGPTPAASLQLTSSGSVSTTLANTTVTFDGILAPLIYVSSGQINVIVPYEIAGRVTTSVIVLRNGIPSAALQLRVADTAPAIFSATQTGNGQGAILNFNSSFNSAQNPAPKGSVISIYATGEGALNPQVVTGSVTSTTGPTFPRPTGAVSVTIAGQPAVLQYVGEAPSLVSGVLQINAVVPQNIGSGPQTVVLTVGAGTNSQQTITVAVQ